MSRSLLMTVGLFPLLDPRSASAPIADGEAEVDMAGPPQPPGSAGPGSAGDSEAPAEPLAMCTSGMRTTNVHRPTADGC